MSAICCIEGCNNLIHNKKRQLCNSHYLRFIRHGDPHKGLSKRDLATVKYVYTYNSYRSMRERCRLKTCKIYRRYGGKGIDVCDQWKGKDGFHHFLEDMGERPQNTTLDRIDNSKGYCPDNCRWSTPRQQNANKSNTSKIYPGVYFRKERKNGKAYCANFLDSKRTPALRLAKCFYTAEEAITQRKEWENLYKDYSYCHEELDSVK